MAHPRDNRTRLDGAKANPFREYARRARQVVRRPDRYITVEPAELDVRNDFGREHRGLAHFLRRVRRLTSPPPLLRSQQLSAMSEHSTTRRPTNPLPPTAQHLLAMSEAPTTRRAASPSAEKQRFVVSRPSMASLQLSSASQGRLAVSQSSIAMRSAGSPQVQQHFAAPQPSIDRMSARLSAVQQQLAPLPFNPPLYRRPTELDIQLARIEHERAQQADLKYQLAIQIQYNEVLWRHGIGQAIGHEAPVRYKGPVRNPSARGSMFRARQPEPMGLTERIVTNVLKSRGYPPRRPQTTENSRPNQIESIADSQTMSPPAVHQSRAEVPSPLPKTMTGVVSNRTSSTDSPQPSGITNNCRPRERENIAGSEMMEHRGARHNPGIVPSQFQPAPQRTGNGESSVDFRYRVSVSETFGQKSIQSYVQLSSERPSPPPVNSITQNMHFRTRDVSSQKRHTQAEQSVHIPVQRVLETIQIQEAQTQQSIGSKRSGDRPTGIKTLPGTGEANARRRPIGVKTLPGTDEANAGRRPIGVKTLPGTVEANARHTPIGVKTLPDTEESKARHRALGYKPLPRMDEAKVEHKTLGDETLPSTREDQENEAKENITTTRGLVSGLNEQQIERPRRKKGSSDVQTRAVRQQASSQASSRARTHQTKDKRREESLPGTEEDQEGKAKTDDNITTAGGSVSGLNKQPTERPRTRGLANVSTMVTRQRASSQARTFQPNDKRREEILPGTKEGQKTEDNITSERGSVTGLSGQPTERPTTRGLSNVSTMVTRQLASSQARTCQTKDTRGKDNTTNEQATAPKPNKGPAKRKRTREPSNASQSKKAKTD
ncbi:uncharacterized protein BP5553_02702 [Venustampulla echinocandica]|uniref:Uncharacterized protein n=1 Tax=Venustampulla echinocandica TaxID=2656787 RepID=A0A370TS50_9HELO|nr:uncharacterized protein BP5553_02702 [Venustampulla echinocandica]RDL38362.1 hypothetical protein BP5553_02702 [Venustampulla echinocandica]